MYKKAHKAGFATLYLNEPTFTSFMRYFVALPYLPLEELREAVEEAASWTFNPELPEKELERVERFKVYMVDYTKKFWLDSWLEPASWNFWQHSRGNTNNRYIYKP